MHRIHPLLQIDEPPVYTLNDIIIIRKSENRSLVKKGNNVNNQLLIWVCTKRRRQARNADSEDNSSCGLKGGRAVAKALEMELIRHAIMIPIKHVDCFGSGCDEGPNVRLFPFNKDFKGVVVEKVPGIVQQIRYILQTTTPKS